VHASLHYSQSGTGITVSFDDISDLDSCSSMTQWLFHLSYSGGTNQSGTYDTGQTSINETFDIPNGTVIDSLEIWAGNSVENAQAGSCTVSVASGFTWDSSTGPTV